MAVSYKRLWKLLVDKEMSKSDLRKKAEIAPNTMTKLRRDEEVSLTILSKICKTLHADFGDIVESHDFERRIEFVRVFQSNLPTDRPTGAGRTIAKASLCPMAIRTAGSTADRQRRLPY